MKYCATKENIRLISSLTLSLSLSLFLSFSSSVSLSLYIYIYIYKYGCKKIFRLPWLSGKYPELVKEFEITFIHMLWDICKILSIYGHYIHMYSHISYLLCHLKHIKISIMASERAKRLFWAQYITAFFYFAGHVLPLCRCRKLPL
jgi:hypothetical protein